MFDNKDCLHVVASHLSGFDLARFACVCRIFRDVARDDTLWQAACARDFNLHTKECVELGPSGGCDTVHQTNTFREAHLSFRRLCAVDGLEENQSQQLDGGFQVRATKFFSEASSILQRKGAHEIVESLQPAVSVSRWTDFCDRLGLRPQCAAAKALRALFRCHDGQSPGTRDEVLRGLLGGFSAYNSVVSTHLLTLLTSLQTTLQLRDMQSRIVPTHIVIASSFNGTRLICVEEESCLVYMYPEQNDGRNVPLRVVPRNEPGSQPDGLLRWLEHYLQCLRDNTYEPGSILPDHPEFTRGIVLFPQRGPLFRQHVTRGVLVTATSLWMGGGDMGFIYSIRVRLLQPGEEGYLTPEQRGFKTCQLSTRHWEIHAGDGAEPKHVRGPGVVGKHPLLFEGGFREDDYRTIEVGEPGDDVAGDFVYQSCSGPMPSANSGQASFGGEFQFVAPSLQNQQTSFDVIVPRFPLIPHADFFY